MGGVMETSKGQESTSNAEAMTMYGEVPDPWFLEINARLKAEQERKEAWKARAAVDGGENWDAARPRAQQTGTETVPSPAAETAACRGIRKNDYENTLLQL